MIENFAGLPPTTGSISWPQECQYFLVELLIALTKPHNGRGSNMSSRPGVDNGPDLAGSLKTKKTNNYMRKSCGRPFWRPGKNSLPIWHTPQRFSHHRINSSLIIFNLYYHTFTLPIHQNIKRCISLCIPEFMCLYF